MYICLSQLQLFGALQWRTTLQLPSPLLPQPGRGSFQWINAEVDEPLRPSCLPVRHVPPSWFHWTDQAYADVSNEATCKLVSNISDTRSVLKKQSRIHRGFWKTPGVKFTDFYPNKDDVENARACSESSNARIHACPVLSLAEDRLETVR